MTRKARIVPFDRSKPGGVNLMDTGEDSIYLSYGHGESANRSPLTIEVHMHEEVDETVVLLGGEGYYLHGPTPQQVVKSPYKGPCLLFLPAGEYHRIVTTSEGAREHFLMYTPAGVVVEPFDAVINRARRGVVQFTDLPEVLL